MQPGYPFFPRSQPVVTVRILCAIVGPAYSYSYGDEVEIEQDYADRLVASQMAVYMSDKPPESAPEPEPVRTVSIQPVQPVQPWPDPGPTPQLETVPMLRDVEGIAPRTLALLEGAGVVTVEQFLALEDPTQIKGIGAKTSAQIREQIEAGE